MKLKPDKGRTIEQQIKELAKAGRAPACASCGGAGSLSGGRIGYIFCNVCGAKYNSLTEAWKAAARRTMKSEEGKEVWWRVPGAKPAVKGHGEVERLSLVLWPAIWVADRAIRIFNWAKALFQR